jgi:hypothetical protein
MKKGNTLGFVAVNGLGHPLAVADIGFSSLV